MKLVVERNLAEGAIGKERWRVELGMEGRCEAVDTEEMDLLWKKLGTLHSEHSTAHFDFLGQRKHTYMMHDLGERERN